MAKASSEGVTFGIRKRQPMEGDQANAHHLQQHMLAAPHRPGSEVTLAAFSHLALTSQCEEHYFCFTK